MILTYLDSGVLIAAIRGRDSSIGQQALALLSDPERRWASSDFVRLEVEPKAAYYGRPQESAFYQQFFEAVLV